MASKLRIAFVWQGITGRYGIWDDGLKRAMKMIGEKHTVTYHEPSDDITDVDLILYWESPCTINGKDKDNWLKVVNNPIKKALLFSGGPIKKEWITPFNHIFVESKINLDEVQAMGLPVSTAFGINDEVFKYKPQNKVWNAVHHGACASWKRQWLVGDAFRAGALIFGRYQETDPRPFDDCRKFGCSVLGEQTPEEAAALLNACKVFCQTSEFWGGGQRATLEAMHCGLPVIVMSDSPKNIEFIEGIPGNAIAEPNVQSIKEAYETLKDIEVNRANIDYVESKWTAKHYADSLLEVIERL